MPPSESKHHVLITGASIAGNALAFWLERAGHAVTLVERTPGFREGGQNIDVRGAARTVLQRMSLEAQVDAWGTRERGVVFVDENDEVVAEFDQADGEDSLTAELEILRGDLAHVLADATGDRVERRYDDSIRAVTSSDDGVQVTFESGRAERFDLAVIAEGVGSSTRELVFAGENEPRWLDVDMGYFSIPRGPRDGDLARWYNAPGGRSVFLRPDRLGTTTRAVLTLQRAAEGEQDWDVDRQKSFLGEQFADAGWDTERVLDGLRSTDDFYFDVLRQVKLPRWSKGRVVLLGDAAWCATPIAGAGTSLAIVGAYVLAGEIQRQPSPADALAAYEMVLRPYVEQAQDVPKIGPRFAQPQSRLGVLLQRALLGVAARPTVQKLVKPLFSSKTEAIELPDYPLR